MQFSSLEFIFGFFPLFMIFYHFTPTSAKNIIIVTGSILFYGFCCADSLWAVGLLIFMTLFTYYVTLYVKDRPVLLFAGIGCMTAVLTFFKLYADGKFLPLGMSFYLFQMSAYLIDVYKGRAALEKSLVKWSARVLMFPKLLSGPILKPSDWPARPVRRKPLFRRGVEEFVLGLSMKVLLADRLGGLWAKATVVGYESLSVPMMWMALVSFALRLYLDFWSYSLMACGMGAMLGFRFPENFNDPYCARSVSEFYRRWHMSLGAWFREYLYFPLGGSRKGSGRTVLNLLAVWLVTGLWHGTGSNYLVWALVLVLFIIQEKLWLGKILNKYRIFSHVYTVAVILLSWIPFAVPSFDQMITCFGRLFGLCGQALNSGDVLSWGIEYLPYLAAGIIFASPLPGKVWTRFRGSMLSDCVLFALFWISVYMIASGAQSTFLYFQF